MMLPSFQSPAEPISDYSLMPVHTVIRLTLLNNCSFLKLVVTFSYKVQRTSETLQTSFKALTREINVRTNVNSNQTKVFFILSEICGDQSVLCSTFCLPMGSCEGLLRVLFRSYDE